MKPFCVLLAAATMVAGPAFAADTDAITIGFTASRTGPLNVDSTGQERGFEFWRDEVNAKGGIPVGNKHYQVKFVSYDDQSVGGRVQQLYTRTRQSGQSAVSLQSLLVRTDGGGGRRRRTVRQDHGRQRRR